MSENPKMSVNKVLTKDYEKTHAFRLRENKPNQTQFQDAQICNHYDAGPGNDGQSQSSEPNRRIDKKPTSGPKKRDFRKINAEKEETGEPGFGPGLTDPESVVLPLHYSPKTQINSRLLYIRPANIARRLRPNSIILGEVLKGKGKLSEIMLGIEHIAVIRHTVPDGPPKAGPARRPLPPHVNS